MKTEGVDNILRDIRTILGEEYCNNSVGSIFYAGLNALQDGPFYLMGWNPGGNPKEIEQNIAQSLDNWRRKPSNWSEYLCERWGRYTVPGRAPHQKNVVYFCHKILKRNVRTVFSVNAAFQRTSRGNDLPDDSNTDTKYWEVHKFLMSHVRPKVLICLGNNLAPDSSSFAKVTKWLKVKQEPIKNKCGVYRNKFVYVKYFPEPVDLFIEEEQRCIKFHVIGIPHPSGHWYHKIDQFQVTFHEVLKELKLHAYLGPHEIHQIVPSQSHRGRGAYQA